jgi:hypothetical protein
MMFQIRTAAYLSRPNMLLSPLTIYAAVRIMGAWRENVVPVKIR